MAFSKASDDRKLILPNTNEQIFKAYVEKEDLSAGVWPHKWGWILDEYRDLNEKLAAITAKSVAIEAEKRTDFRSPKPIPNSVNHEYGWIASREDFKLEIYGPDVPKPPPPSD